MPSSDSPPPLGLVRRARVTVAAPQLDEDQQRVVDHRAGPMLVLAGPGTGKTTTLVETLVERVARGVEPDRLLTLTFSRKAAGELRRRASARLGRTTREPLAMTFHSFAYALLRREAALAGEPPPRLLTGPEQLLDLRRMLRGDVDDGGADWPASLRPALATRGFAEELRDLLLRAQERGLDPRDLVALGEEHSRPAWVAAGRFAERHASRYALEPAMTYDYAELVDAATRLLDDPRVLQAVAPRVVLVDEYQDTDPAQERLLSRLASVAEEVIVVGDPRQSIYGFRGADVRCIIEFPDRAAQWCGQVVDVVRLRHIRRFGGLVGEAAQRISALVPQGSDRSLDRGGVAEVASGPETALEVRLCDSESQEAATVADVLRRAHLEDGVRWQDMAVLVRSSSIQVPILRRALSAAGVPVTVAGDEVPLVQEAALRPLLLLIGVALGSTALDEEVACELLTGPLGRADALGVRRLRRELRRRELEHVTAQVEAESAGQGEGDGPAPRMAARSSGELLVAALTDARELSDVRPASAEPAVRILELVRDARTAAAAGTVEDVLWAVWQGSGLPARLRRESLAGGASGEQADRAIEAVSALFEAAARFTDRLPGASLELFLQDLAAQEIPADSLSESDSRGDALRILTAHRAKGLEWPLVVVAGVQEGRWPDLRLRGSLLGVTELVQSAGPEGKPSLIGVTKELLAEERRLFFVAVTRAQQRLVLTAVGAADDAEVRPSRFVDELVPRNEDGQPPAGVLVTEPGATVASGRAPAPLSLAALVAELRRAACDVAVDETVRRAAAARLAVLSQAGARGADPRGWRGVVGLSDERPLLDVAEPLTIQPSGAQSFTKCALRWWLQRVAPFEGSAASNIGNLVHALAQVAEADPSLTEADLLAVLDEHWASVDVGAVWFARAERERVGKMVTKFLAYRTAAAAAGRTLVAIEEPFEVEVGEVGGRLVKVKGRVDRLERDPESRGFVVDLKTNSTKVPPEEVPRHAQLATYQIATRAGAFHAHDVIESGGAALLQLGKGGGVKGLLQEQRALGSGGSPGSTALSSDGEPGSDEWADELLRSLVEGMSAGIFVASPSTDCKMCGVRGCCPASPDGAQL